MADNSGKKKGIWKLVVGILLLICAIRSLSEPTFLSVVYFIVGIILIILYFWPVIRPHLKAYQERELEKKNAEEEKRKVEEERNSEWHVCNSCGAKFQGTKCPYCRSHISET